MTPKERAAMQQALEALEDLIVYSWNDGKNGEPDKAEDYAGVEAITALREALAEQAEQDLDTCPGCGGVADNGHDREFPPNPYYCTKCSEQAERVTEGNGSEVSLETEAQEPVAIDWDTVHTVLCEVWNRDSSADEGLEEIQDLIYAAPQPVKQEPVAEVVSSHQAGLYDELPIGTKLYAAPVRTKDLTDDEIDEIPFNRVSDDPLLEYARAVIAAYKEKNK